MTRLAFLPPLALVLGACSAPSDGDDTSETTQAIGAARCTPALLLPQATGNRKKIIERAAVWVNDPLPYSMTTWHEGYRQDCSGFVGMAWKVSGSMTTAHLPPRADNSSYAKKISWASLEPGDAIARGPTKWSEVGHVRLFAGKAADGSMCFWEQTMGFFTPGGTEANTYSESETADDGFVAIRKKGL
jgi:hypothetical protein